MTGFCEEENDDDEDDVDEEEEEDEDDDVDEEEEEEEDEDDDFEEEEEEDDEDELLLLSAASSRVGTNTVQTLLVSSHSYPVSGLQVFVQPCTLSHSSDASLMPLPQTDCGRSPSPQRNESGALVVM